MTPESPLSLSLYIYTPDVHYIVRWEYQLGSPYCHGSQEYEKCFSLFSTGVFLHNHLYGNLFIVSVFTRLKGFFIFMQITKNQAHKRLKKEKKTERQSEKPIRLFKSPTIFHNHVSGSKNLPRQPDDGHPHCKPQPRGVTRCSPPHAHR